MSRVRRDDEVVRITTASDSPSKDIAARQKRYILSMAFRTACFVGAVFARHIVWLWPLLIAAALILPYVAVVMANLATPHLPGDPVEGPPAQGELGPGERRHDE